MDERTSLAPRFTLACASTSRARLRSAPRIRMILSSVVNATPPSVSVLRSPPDDAAPAQLHAYLASAERSVLSEDAYLADSLATCLLGDGISLRPSVLRSPPDDAAPAQLHAYLASAERSALSEDAYLADSPAGCLLGDGIPLVSSVLHNHTPLDMQEYHRSSVRTGLTETYKPNIPNLSLSVSEGTIHGDEDGISAFSCYCTCSTGRRLA